MAIDFERPETFDGASLKASNYHKVEYCCSIYDDITSITWHVFREMFDQKRYVLYGDDEYFTVLGMDNFSVFNYIVNHDKCQHEFEFDFVYADKSSINGRDDSRVDDYWIDSFEEWNQWVASECTLEF